MTEPDKQAERPQQREQLLDLLLRELDLKLILAFGTVSQLGFMAVLVGIDKFMSECRALTNLVGNGVATVVISRWEGELDAKALHETMAHPLQIGEELETQTI